MLTDPDMKIKPRGKIFSLNEGYAALFDDKLTKYLKSLKFPEVNGFLFLIIRTYQACKKIVELEQGPWPWQNVSKVLPFGFAAFSFELP